MADSRLSQHRIDVLIRRIASGSYRPSAGEVKQILEKIAAAPFDPKQAPVPPPLVGTSYLDFDLGDHAPAAIVHLIQRVIGDEQWRRGTTLSQYLDDLQAAVRSRDARLAIYWRRGGAIAATLTPTGAVVPPGRLGDDTLPALFVVYSADRGIILSGYQVSGLETVGIPEDVIWLT